jgi:hypothetical protein
VRHVTPLLAAALLLIGGGYSYAVDETVPGVALLSAGLITLGAWLALEVRGVVRPRPPREEWAAVVEDDR